MGVGYFLPPPDLPLTAIIHRAFVFLVQYVMYKITTLNYFVRFRLYCLIYITYVLIDFGVALHLKQCTIVTLALPDPHPSPTTDETHGHDPTPVTDIDSPASVMYLAVFAGGKNSIEAFQSA